MQFSIEADEEFLRVRAWGRDTGEPPSHLCAAVLKESERLERKLILIELDQKFPLSPTAQHQLVTRLPGLGLTPQHRIALVHRTPTAQMANDFITLVADNRSLAVRNFHNVEDASAWLRLGAA